MWLPLCHWCGIHRTAIVPGTIYLRVHRPLGNVLELKAIVLALNAFLDTIAAEAVVFIIDNATLVAYLRKQGGHHVKGVTRSSSGGCPMDRRSFGSSFGQTHSLEEHSGRPAESSRPGPSHSVVSSWVFDAVCEVYSRPLIELFATRRLHYI